MGMPWPQGKKGAMLVQWISHALGDQVSISTHHMIVGKTTAHRNS